MITVFYGGTFDPFHDEHRTLIEGAHEELNADRVVVYPSYCPPHKDGDVSPFAARMEMVQAAVGDLPYVFVDTIEKERDCVNYSYEVLPILKEKYPSDEYYFLIGGDSMAFFSQWKNPQIIAKETKIAVVDRSDTTDIHHSIRDAEERYGANIVLLKTKGKSVSSSVIKAQTELGMQPTDIFSSVYSIIQKYHLYHSFESIVERVRDTIPERTFRHVCRTVICALKLNTKLNLSYKKVFLAAFLHDCTKHLPTEMSGVPLSVVHQYTGAVAAKDVYGVEDEEVLDAIRYHTTGKPKMTMLGKLIYCSDILEEGRDFPGVDDLRTAIRDDFEKGFRTCVKSCMEKLIRDGKPFDPLTKECALYYNII